MPNSEVGVFYIVFEIISVSGRSHPHTLLRVSKRAHYEKMGEKRFTIGSFDL